MRNTAAPDTHELPHEAPTTLPSPRDKALHPTRKVCDANADQTPIAEEKEARYGADHGAPHGAKTHAN
jgi:hypothetical protein